MYSYLTIMIILCTITYQINIYYKYNTYYIHNDIIHNENNL